MANLNRGVGLNYSTNCFTDNLNIPLNGPFGLQIILKVPEILEVWNKRINFKYGLFFYPLARP